MLEFLSSPGFLFVVVGFIISYLYQVVIRGPKEADQKKRIDEYMARLSPEAHTRIRQTLEANDKAAAIEIFGAETKVGLKEAKECINFMIREMKRKG